MLFHPASFNKKRANYRHFYLNPAVLSQNICFYLIRPFFPNDLYFIMPLFIIKSLSIKTNMTEPVM